MAFHWTRIAAIAALLGTTTAWAQEQDTDVGTRLDRIEQRMQAMEQQMQQRRAERDRQHEQRRSELEQWRSQRPSFDDARERSEAERQAWQEWVDRRRGWQAPDADGRFSWDDDAFAQRRAEAEQRREQMRERAEQMRQWPGHTGPWSTGPAGGPYSPYYRPWW